MLLVQQHALAQYCQPCTLYEALNFAQIAPVATAEEISLMASVSQWCTDAGVSRSFHHSSLPVG
eukprot:6162030-Amphidinium_carterae.1